MLPFETSYYPSPSRIKPARRCFNPDNCNEMDRSVIVKLFSLLLLLSTTDAMVSVK